MFKIIFSIFSIVLLTASKIFGQTAAKNDFDPNYRIIHRNAVRDKSFYLLGLLQDQSKFRKILRKNKVLRGLSNEHKNDLTNAEKCADVNCFDRAFRLNDAEIETIAKIFENPANDAKLNKLIDKQMCPSGVFIKYAANSDAEMLAFAWRDAAKGLTRILDVYGLGKPPLYKDIDSASYDVNSNEYRQLVKTKVGEIKLPKDALFFEPMLDYALKLLEINRRNEAGRHEPLEQTKNKKAFENLKNISWNNYPHSVILVLGSGPSAKLGDAPNIGKIGMERADVAVKLFQEKKAPLIILSGGYVHPAQTPYSEASEMKKYIIEKYAIPENVIFVDPFARHTTTNVRNAARIMLRDGIPIDKKGIITSSESHIEYVGGEQFAKRLTDELGFVPMLIFKRISPAAIEFQPLPNALFMNSLDPLDP